MERKEIPPPPSQLCLFIVRRSPGGRLKLGMQSTINPEVQGDLYLSCGYLSFHPFLFAIVSNFVMKLELRREAKKLQKKLEMVMDVQFHPPYQSIRREWYENCK